MIRCIEDLLNEAQVAELQALADKCEFVDGSDSAGTLAGRVKNNLQATCAQHERDVLERVVSQSLGSHPTVQRFALPRRIHAPLLSCYLPGMGYGAHTDNALIGADAFRADISVTVFISDPDNYDGGELNITTSYGDLAIKLSPGSAVLYPTGAVHRVTPITRGQRIAAVTWIQSHVRCPSRRQILADMHAVKTHLEAVRADDEHALLAAKSYSNLMRCWSE